MKWMAISAAAVLSGLSVAQTVVIDSKQVVFDAPPRMVNGTLMVPMRCMFESMNATMRWRSDKDVVEGMRGGHRAEIWTQSREARVDGKMKQMDELPFVWKGRTYAPLKFLAESLGYSLSHEGNSYVLRDTGR